MSEAKCAICGELMPAGEEMFQYHGYSGDCPKPPLHILPKQTYEALESECARLLAKFLREQLRAEAAEAKLDKQTKIAVEAVGQIKITEDANEVLVGMLARAESRLAAVQSERDKVCELLGKMRKQMDTHNLFRHYDAGVEYRSALGKEADAMIIALKSSTPTEGVGNE